MEEQRRLERFNIKFPTKLEVFTSENKQVFNVVTRNISADGAYFRTPTPIRNNTHVRVTLSINNNILRKFKKNPSLLKIRGIVVRSDPTGLAVRFTRKFRVIRRYES